MTPLPAADRTDVAPHRPGKWPWVVCWLMFASTVLNYMDRQAVAMVSTPIKAEFHLSNQDFGWVMAVFLISYALFQVPAGLIVDRADVRPVYGGAVALWSLAAVGSAFSPTLGVLLVLRVILGVGESFNWPCALSVTARLLPPSDRSLGNGIFNSGAAVGAVLTPLLVTFLSNQFGWRTSFIVVGVLGAVWIVVWRAVVGPSRPGLDWSAPARPVRPMDREREVPSRRAVFSFVALGLVSAGIAASAVVVGLSAVWWGVACLMFGLPVVARLVPAEGLAGLDWAASLGEVVRNRRFLVLVVVSISINVCWHFLVSWMPTYLKEDRGMTFLASGLWTAVPFLAADVGNLGGGALSRALAARGVPTFQARLAVMSGCTVMVASGAAVGLARNDTVVLLLLGVMAAGAAGFMANYFAFTQEVSTRNTGLIVGYLGGLGNLCAAAILPLAGLTKDRTGGFGPVFVLVGLLPFIGLATLRLGWRDNIVEPPPVGLS